MIRTIAAVAIPPIFFVALYVLASFQMITFAARVAG
jgi:hypothetical protein